MTKDYKQMKHLVEKAGRCWHEVADANGGCVYDPVNKTVTCFKCGKAVPITPNPSPHSMDALLELAKVLGFEEGILISYKPENKPEWGKCVVRILDTQTEVVADEVADALRLAMCRATGWKE